MRSAWILIASSVLLTDLSAQRRYVDAGNAAPGNGLSWSGSFNKLENALAAAAANDEVWVAAGTYSGGFTVPAQVRVLGGFRPGDLRVWERSPATNRTILDGGSSQRVLVLGDRSLLDGFVVQNGSATAPGGGAVLMDGTSPTVRNCVFRKNRVSGGRGSVMLLVNRADPVVENCYFVENDSFGGHTIDINTAGGLFLNIVLYANFDNGIHFQLGSFPRIYNCIFAKGTSRAICHIHSNDTPIFENNLLVDHNVSLYHIQGRELRTIAEVNALPYAKNNISVDPAFVNATTFDLRLSPTSPCIDAGSATFRPSGASPRDFFGNSRLLDGNLDGGMVADIGAHEFANITLEVTGTPLPGGPFRLDVTGRAGLLAVLALASTTSPGILVDPLGYWFTDPQGSLIVLPWGQVPSQTTLTVPPEIPAGTLVPIQALALNPALAGNTSNLIDLRIR